MGGSPLIGKVKHEGRQYAISAPSKVAVSSPFILSNSWTPSMAIKPITIWKNTLQPLLLEIEKSRGQFLQKSHVFVNLLSSSSPKHHQISDGDGYILLWHLLVLPPKSVHHICEIQLTVSSLPRKEVLKRISPLVPTQSGSLRTRGKLSV